jgi:membrane protein
MAADVSSNPTGHVQFQHKTKPGHFFEIGKAAIGFYIGQGLESTYGAAASIVVVLIWVYYKSEIILMGAEITHSYAKQNGSLKRA